MTMTDDEIKQVVLGEITAAREHIDNNVAAARMDRWDRYYGRKLGNEKKGQSTWRSRDVMDTVEWMLPYLVRTFTSGQSPIKLSIDGQPSWVGEALQQQIHKDLDTNEEKSFFLTAYEWIKDALVSATAANKISWARDTEKKNLQFEILTQEQAAEIEQAPDLEVVAGEEGFDPYTQAPIIMDAKVQVTKVIRDDLRMDAVPHWEFLYVPKTQSINDEHGKGQQTEVSLDYIRRIDRGMSNGAPFFKNIKDLEDLGGGDQEPSPFIPSVDGTEGAEKQQFMGFDSEAGVDEKGPRKRIKFVEWYTRVDTDGDGYSEDIVCWLADNVLLRWEKNKDGFIPISVLSPILDCYKMQGISYADLVVEIQNLKTMIIRRILDNYAYSNQGRWVVQPGIGFDVSTLQDNVPGDVIYGNPEAVKDLAPKPFHPGILNLVEYADTIKENRTGISRYNQGMDGNSLNKTASGIGMIQNAAHQRLEMVARIFAETGFKDMIVKSAKLYQQYQSLPFTAKIDGEQREVTPEMLQGKITARVSMGPESQVGHIQSQQIERMFGFLSHMNEQFPGLLRPEIVYRFAARYVSAFGDKDASELIGSMQEYVEEVQSMMQQQSEQQQQGMEMQTAQEDKKIQATMQQSQMEGQNKKDIANIHASVKQMAGSSGDNIKALIARMQDDTKQTTSAWSEKSKREIADLKASVDLLIAGLGTQDKKSNEAPQP